MIKITLLTGPFAGETREVPKNIDPLQLIMSFVYHEDEWEIDYSEATEEEILEFMKADIAGRIIKALKDGRKVYFLDKVYEAETEEEIFEVAQEIEDDIVKSKKFITILKDDENGLIIGAANFFH